MYFRCFCSRAKLSSAQSGELACLNMTLPGQGRHPADPFRRLKRFLLQPQPLRCIYIDAFDGRRGQAGVTAQWQRVHEALRADCGDGQLPDHGSPATAVKAVQRNLPTRKIKNPGQMNRPGLTASVDAHAVRFRKGESTRLTVRWMQVIASSYTGIGYPVDVRINRTTED